MDRNLALEFVRVTEAAAIAAAAWIGKGDGKAADGAAVDEMRDRFNQIENFAAQVVIGEGEKDEAPKLFTGEKVGKGKIVTRDLAVDPLEGTDSVAYGRNNAVSVIVTGPKGTLLHAPDTYMDKIAVGPQAASVIDLNKSAAENLTNIAQALNKKVSELTVIVLDRPRHEKLISEIKEAGAQLRLITDGDLAAAISTCEADSGIDVLMGIGGSAEAVLAAAAVKTFGGQLLARFNPGIRNDEVNVLEFLKKSGISDINKIYTAEDLAKGDELTFTATGIIEGPMLGGVQFKGDKIITESIVVRAKSGTIRYIKTHHKSRNAEHGTRNTF